MRLMTVHKAKGLEFPVVILADLTCRLSRDDASRYLDASARPVRAQDRRVGAARPARSRSRRGDRDQAEGVRLAYVAATRARDLLVVPALGDAPWEGGWISAVEPGGLSRPSRAPRRVTRGPRCPAFKSSKTLCAVRPDEEMAGPATSQPRFSTWMPGDYSVVWWGSFGARPRCAGGCSVSAAKI